MVGNTPHIHDQAGHYDSLMLGYAAGTLDQAQSMLVAAHVALSAAGRNFLSTCNALGGVLLDQHCEPVAMRGNSLQNVLQRLDAAPMSSSVAPASRVAVPEDVPLPACTMQAYGCEVTPQKTWKTIYPGLDVCDLALPCRESLARLMRARPAFKTPSHTHKGLEMMLILKGALEDEDGLYRRGDLIISDESDTHATKACPEQGCVCLVVTTGPIRLTGFASLLNPFIRF
jgi:putative transcriptional regulator